MSIIMNYYELLGLPINASQEDIRQAYKQKVLKCTNPQIKEEYDTAYYVLTTNRYNYDVSLGIKKYRIVPKRYKIMKASARVVLTMMDSILSFYWCFLFVVVCYFGYEVYTKQISILPYINKRQDELIILGCIAVADLILNFYVRRANRKLKHFNWEYKDPK